MTALLLIALAACSSPIADLQRESPHAVLQAMPVCAEVAVKAHAAGLRPALATRLAYHESRFRRDVVSSAGARGPLQAIPRYWCQGPRCDLVAAGLRALRYYLRRARGDERLALCWYTGRRGCV